MGFFSWRTSDTKETIWAVAGLQRPVYLLQPKGLGNVLEECYRGYGDFGGIDAYDWIADMNISLFFREKAERLGIEKRTLGIYLDTNYYIDSRSNKKYAYKLSELFEDINPFPGSYASELDGVEINELIRTGVFVEKPMKEAFQSEYKYKLKFSHDEEAVYEDLPDAEDCDSQGFFIDDDEFAIRDIVHDKNIFINDRAKFTTSGQDSEFKAYDDSIVTVVDIIVVPDEQHGYEVLPMYILDIEHNGKKIEAFIDELSEDF